MNLEREILMKGREHPSYPKMGKIRDAGHEYRSEWFIGLNDCESLSVYEAPKE